jgi:hypothetical protein
VPADGDLAASAVVGLPGSVVSPTVGFGYAAAWMAAGVTDGLLTLWRHCFGVATAHSSDQPSP